MKQALAILAFFSAKTLLAQQDSTTNFGGVLADAVPVIRALVIGISDYRDSLIGDLSIAHKGAEIFAEYLRSSAGGALAEEDIWLMTNKEATLGAIDNALIRQGHHLFQWARRSGAQDT
jgi:hypothetical protein